MRLRAPFGRIRLRGVRRGAVVPDFFGGLAFVPDGPRSPFLAPLSCMAPTTHPATPAAPAQSNTPPANTNTGGISHVMQWGETIWGLAVAYDAWPLSAWHTPSGDINRYYVGDVVTYGGGTAPASSGGVSKVLQWGDTVWDFATAHGYSVSRCTVPSGNINVYYVGDVVTCR